MNGARYEVNARDNGAASRLKAERVVAAKALHVLEVDFVATVGAGEVLHALASSFHPGRPNPDCPLI